MTLRELLKHYIGLYNIKINTGCDYEIFDVSNYDDSWGDSIVNDFMANDQGEIEIECDMVGFDDDGIKRNFVTGEKLS